MCVVLVNWIICRLLLALKARAKTLCYGGEDLPLLRDVDYPIPTDLFTAFCHDPSETICKSETCSFA